MTGRSRGHEIGLPTCEVEATRSSSSARSIWVECILQVSHQSKIVQARVWILCKVLVK